MNQNKGLISLYKAINVNASLFYFTSSVYELNHKQGLKVKI